MPSAWNRPNNPMRTKGGTMSGNTSGMYAGRMKETAPKPQGRGIVKALDQKGTTGNFKKIEAAKGKGAAIGALQNKLAKRRGQKVPYTGGR